MAQKTLDLAPSHTAERKAFGKTLDQFQALQFKLADMETELQAARIFLRHAAWKLDHKTPDATKHCAMAKRFVTDTAFDVANAAARGVWGDGLAVLYHQMARRVVIDRKRVHFNRPTRTNVRD